jgi:antitoxin ParD1/3/4
MATRTIDLTDALDRFVAEQIEAGVYQNASEAVRAGLQLLKAEEEARAAKLERLKAAIREGLESYERGEGEVVDVDRLDDWFEGVAAEAEGLLAHRRAR